MRADANNGTRADAVRSGPDGADQAGKEGRSFADGGIGPGEPCEEAGRPPGQGSGAKSLYPGVLGKP